MSRLPTIELFEDNLEEDDLKHLQPRIGVRAVLKHNDQCIIIYNKHWNLYTLPGGGVIEGETLHEALHREILEETGYTMRILKHTLKLREHFKDSIWEHHYFLCETIEKIQAPELTPLEIEAGTEAVIFSFSEVLDIFNNYETKHLHGDAIHQREFLGFVHSISTHDA